MRGYSDTKPDGNPARSAQSLRRQFGEIYDVNLDRNIYALNLDRNTLPDLNHHKLPKMLRLLPQKTTPSS
jgi:hypothetical protein